MSRNAELLALAALLAEMSEQATQHRGERELVFGALGPLMGAILHERYPPEMFED